MFRKNLFIFYASFSICVCEILQDRQSRFLTFNSQNQDIDVALDFSIPFLKVPLNEFGASSGFSSGGLSFPKINLNPSGLALGGLLLVLASYLGPILGKLFEMNQWDRSSRVLDNGFEQIDFSDTIIRNSRGCPLRVACWLSQTNGESLTTWNQLLSNELLSRVVNTNDLVNATMRGLNGLNCDTYGPCPIPEKDFAKLVSSFNVISNI